MPLGRIGGDDPEHALREADHRHVGVDAPILGEPLCVGDATVALPHRRARQPFEHAARPGPGYVEARHERHVEQARGFPDGLMLEPPLPEPRLPLPRGVGLWHLAPGGIPVGRLHAAHVAQEGPRCDQSVVHG